MKPEKKLLRLAIVVSGDILIISLAYLVAYLIRFGRLARFFERFPSIFLVLMMAAYLAVFYLFDLYALERSSPGRGPFGQVALATGVAAVVALILKYALFLFPIGRGILLIASVLVFLFLLTWRNACGYLFRLLIKPRQVLVLGTGRRTADIREALGASPHEFRLVGQSLDPEGGNVPDSGRQGNPSTQPSSATGQVASLIERQAVDLIVADHIPSQNPGLDEALLTARVKGIDVIDQSEMYQRLTGRVPIDWIGGAAWVLNAEEAVAAEPSYAEKIKRLMDGAISAFVLVVSLPFWPLIMLFIKIDSRGPVFYRQSRVGKNERVFVLLKFRSMLAEAENEQALWASADDRRITRVGRLLRRLHLDELPQLWNILRGDMSLVGPRPERPEFVESLKTEIPYYALRHIVKPGLTGWAQVNYPYAASLEDSREKLEFDLYYISHRSLLVDLKILARTLQAFFAGDPKKKRA